MPEIDTSKLSNTRGVPLGEIAGLCHLLKVHGEMPVRQLDALATDKRIIVNRYAIKSGERLATRLHHRNIALRYLNLVNSRREGANTLYSLADEGVELCRALPDDYSGTHPAPLNFNLREAWRKLFIRSDYVNNHWLRYFSYLKQGEPVVIERVNDAVKVGEGAYLYKVTAGDAKEFWNELDEKEIYKGLRWWTNDVHLTDDRIPPKYSKPFAFAGMGAEPFVIHSSLVSNWINPETDVDQFAKYLVDLLEENNRRLAIPNLLNLIVKDKLYSKENVKEMLTEIYFKYNDVFFFERGSEFLISGSFGPLYKGKQTLDYYKKLGNIWRVGISI